MLIRMALLSPAVLLRVTAHLIRFKVHLQCWHRLSVSHAHIATRPFSVPQDYVKWRGPLFHRFLLALVDDSPGVRALAEFLLSDTLASKVRLHKQRPLYAIQN